MSPEQFEAFARRAGLTVGDPRRRAALYEFVLGYAPRVAACRAVPVPVEADPVVTFIVDEEAGPSRAVSRRERSASGSARRSRPG